MNISKNIVAWVLLIGGVILIIWTLVSSYNIFTGKSEIPEIFEMQSDLSLSSTTGSGQGADIQAQMQKLLQEQLKGLMPTDALPKILNLSVWSILAFILIFGGTQISGIGIKLMNKA